MNGEQVGKLAAKWKCSVRVLYRWKKNRAPLHDDAKMIAWLSSRQKIPEGTATLLETLRTKSAQTPPIKSPVLALGSGNALARLEQAEAKASEAYQRAIESGDAIAIKFFRNEWLEVGEQLRRYDSQVQEAKRVGGDMFSRSECERYLFCASSLFNHGLHYVLDYVVERLPAPVEPATYSLLKQSLETLRANSISAAGTQWEQGGDIPHWVTVAMTTHCEWKNSADEIAKLEKLFRELLRVQLDVIQKTFDRARAGENGEQIR